MCKPSGDWVLFTEYRSKVIHFLIKRMREEENRDTGPLCLKGNVENTWPTIVRVYPLSFGRKSEVKSTSVFPLS
jgi:hypothetical protein